MDAFWIFAGKNRTLYAFAMLKKPYVTGCTTKTNQTKFNKVGLIKVSTFKQLQSSI